jgi:hypothetical protein
MRAGLMGVVLLLAAVVGFTDHAAAAPPNFLGGKYGVSKYTRGPSQPQSKAYLGRNDGACSKIKSCRRSNRNA